MVVKIYFQDERQRLQREYSALSFLRGQGFRPLPTPLLRDDSHQFAVYSFEPGAKVGEHPRHAHRRFAIPLSSLRELSCTRGVVPSVDSPLPVAAVVLALVS